VATAGFAKDEIAGRTVAEVFDPHDASMLEVPLRRAFVGEASEFEFPLRERTYLVRVLPLADSAGAVTLGMALALDITERHAAAREIADSRTRLQLLSRRLIAAHEEERRRVAREVHDDLGQALTGVKIGLGALMPRSSRRDTDDTERRILGVSQVVDGAIESVQRIILRLRPGVLDNLGPVAALEWEAQQFTRQTGVPVTLNLPGDPLAMDSESSTALYRTVQEALTNVARHAAASAVRIGLATTGEELVLHVTDDGCGIPDSDAHRPHSMGILGMRERAFACGGTLEVSRAAAGGTRLVLRLPHRTPEVNIDDH
jgi:signal transduction histidine kinase